MNNQGKKDDEMTFSPTTPGAPGFENLLTFQLMHLKGIKPFPSFFFK
jgi:hypothetical protein